MIVQFMCSLSTVYGAVWVSLSVVYGAVWGATWLNCDTYCTLWSTHKQSAHKLHRKLYRNCSAVSLIAWCSLCAIALKLHYKVYNHSVDSSVCSSACFYIPHWFYMYIHMHRDDMYVQMHIRSTTSEYDLHPDVHPFSLMNDDPSWLILGSSSGPEVHTTCFKWHSTST